MEEKNEIREMRWNIYRVSLDKFSRDFWSLIHLWKNRVRITLTEEALQKMKRGAYYSKLGGFAHVRFDESCSYKFVDIFFNVENLEVVSIQIINDDGKPTMYSPSSRANIHLVIASASKMV